MPYSSNLPISGLDAKATPVNADVLIIGDSEDSNRGKKTTWAEIKTTLGSLFAPIASPTFTGTVTTPAIIVSSETASTIASFDGSKNIKSLATATYPSLTELSYVKGATSSLQTQLGTKAPTASPTFTTSITGAYLTASEMLITDGSKNIVSAPVATYPSLTELSYVKGVTSAIQTQLNSVPAITTVLNTVSSAVSYLTYPIIPLANATANDLSGFVVSGATIAADQGGAGYVLYAPVADSFIYTTLPGIGSNATLRFADIGANPITIKFRAKFGTAGSGERISFGIVDNSPGFGSSQTSTTDSTIRFVLSESTGNKIFAVNQDNSANTNTNVSGAYTLTSWHTYQMTITSSSVLFYIDGTLVATHTTNLPTTTNPILIGWGVEFNGGSPTLGIAPTLITVPTS